MLWPTPLQIMHRKPYNGERLGRSCMRRVRRNSHAAVTLLPLPRPQKMVQRSQLLQYLPNVSKKRRHSLSPQRLRKRVRPRTLQRRTHPLQTFSMPFPRDD